MLSRSLSSGSWRSLRTRITAGVLLAVVSTLWIATFVIGHFLRQDMEETLSAQQFSVVSLLADEVDRSVRERMQALETVAAELDENALADTQRVTGILQHRPVFLSRFNWGVILTDARGMSLTSLPPEFKRTGIDYSSVAVVQQVLKEARTVIGDAIIGPTTHQPLVPMATPVRNARGEVVGALIGLTNLNRPNFLDDISGNRFGRQGGYLITDPKSRIFIAATDKSRVMRPGPARGVNAVFDKYIDGFDGSGVAQSSRGVVELSSSKRIPATGWLMQSVLPAEEAFAPISRIQQRLMGTSILLTLLAGSIAWWWLCRQLAPLTEAAALLTAMGTGGHARRPLPVRQDDEIGQLAGAFNGLLAAIVAEEGKAAENAVNARLRKIVSNVPGIVFQYLLRPDGSASLPFASDAIQAIYGLEGREVLADTEKMRALLHPDDQERFFQAIKTSAQDLTPWRCEYRITPAGGEKWLQINALPERDEDGSTLWYGFVTDISRLKEAEGELRIAAATFESQQGMFITDADRYILRINRAFTELTGYGPEDALGQTPAFLRSGRHDEAFYRDMYACLETTGMWQGELWNRHKNGEVLAVWSTTSAVRDGSGRVTHFVTAFSNITERKQAEERLRQNKEMMQAILNAIQESIFLIDPTDRVIAVNPTAAHRMGMEPRDLVGKNLFGFFPAALAESRRSMVHQVILSGLPCLAEDERHGIHFSNRFYPLFDSNGKAEAVVVVATDITDRKRLEHDLELQARTDPLTGLFNRRHFMPLAENELARAIRYRGSLSAIMLDIDHFKRINDTRGHRTGDLVLQHLAKLAKLTLRDVDIVGRLGGEEFAILLPQTGIDQALEVADRLRQAIAESEVMPDAGLPLRYTASLGVACVTQGVQTNVDALLNEADQALYAAKKAGRNRVCQYVDIGRPALSSYL